MSDHQASVPAIVTDKAAVKNDAAQDVTPTGKPDQAKMDLTKITVGGSLNKLKEQHPDIFDKFMNMWMYQVCLDAKTHNDHLVRTLKEARKNDGG